LTTEPPVITAQLSKAGIKPDNEDACGIELPDQSLLHTKGIVAVIADGVSGSEAGKEASTTCVQGFLSDYFSTPESWTVKTSGHKILSALNRWLYGQGHQLYGSAKGMVTTLSVLILKSGSAYLFHVGDTRIYRLRDGSLERLTQDHRVRVAGDKNYLSRALGIELNIEIDFRSLGLEAGDLFLLTTDGIHDFVDDKSLFQILQQHIDNPEHACKTMIATALENGSNDNLSCQILQVIKPLKRDEASVYQQLTELPFPPPLEPGMTLDGYKILRELHSSKRTECFLALDENSGDQMVIKAPSVNYEDDPAYIDMFFHEEWVGKRLNNPHVLKILEPPKRRQFLYHVTEYVEGQSLRQWMHDHPQPELREVRNIIDQIVNGLRAFHRLEMIHQDLKPENIMIDKYGTVKIIDFGSTKIAGIEEISTPIERLNVLGTVNYTAPEYLLGYAGTNRSDIFSLGVIVYEMLTGKLPYGQAKAQNKAHRLQYISAIEYRQDLPPWVDSALEKAVAQGPEKRYSTLSELLYDLSHPNPAFIKNQPLPLIERNPVGFWRATAIALLLINLILLFWLVQSL